MTSKTLEPNNPLDDLFAQARRVQPEFVDDNFTKVVMNTLALSSHQSSQEVSLKGAISKRAISVDGVALLLGATATYLFADTTQILAGLINMVPETLTFDPFAIIAYAGGITLASVAAWWALENSNL